MINSNRPVILLSGEYRLFVVFAVAFSILIGLLVATQPIMIAAIFVATTALIVLSTNTPIVVLIALLVLAPLRTLIATETASSFPLDIGQMLFVFLCCMWCLYKIVTNKETFRLYWSKLYIPLFVYILVTGLTAFNALSLGAWVTEWLKWVLVLILVVIVLEIGQNARWEWIIFGLVLAGLANALVGIYIFFGGSGALHLLVKGRFFRAFGTFGQPNPFGGFMGLIAPVAIMSAYGYVTLLWKRWSSTKAISWTLSFAAVFYGIASVIIVAALFLSWSRGAWLGFGVSMMVLLFALPRRIWHGIFLVTIIAGLLIILWIEGFLPSSVIDRISSASQEMFVLTDVRAVNITNDNYAIVERLAHWQAALNMAEYNPFLGIGFGNYEVAYEQYRLINWREPLGHAHNYYLNVLAETGIIGLTVYIAVFVNIGWLTWRTRAHPDSLSRCVTVGLLGAWSYLLVHSLTDNLYVNNVFMHIGVLLGILAVLNREISQKISISSDRLLDRRRETKTTDAEPT